MVEYGVPILIILFLCLINGFFVAAEFAIAGASRPRVAGLAEAGSASAQRVLHVLHDPQSVNRYLSTAQIGITIASLGLGMYGEHAVAKWLVGPLEHLGWLSNAAAHTIAFVISVAILTYLHMVLGEMIPKSLALHSATSTAIQLSAAMAITDWFFRPITIVLNWISNWLLRIIGIPIVGAEARLVSTTELSYIVEESSEGGLIDPSEQIFLENVIDFSQRSVSQVLTPRTRMAALSADADRMTTLSLICEEHHSRYPVYEVDRDHIIGILHVKDVARHLLTNDQEWDLRSLVRPAVFVPESISLDDMLAQFRTQHFQVAIVMDEYGGTAGIVTLEDLAEEIVGEIQDEFDEELPPFVALDEHTLRVRGDLILDELTQHYDLDFEIEEAEDLETVGGLIMSVLGHVAQPGDEAVVQNVRFVVEAVDGLAVSTALVYLPEESAERPEPDATDQDQNNELPAPPQLP
ncbi:MAG: HlyC/CorC family transporter [Caldilineaceae bacterium]|nr:HlyC/CorC family transporter [Caldilineaceae bacterium]